MELTATRSWPRLLSQYATVEDSSLYPATMGLMYTGLIATVVLASATLQSETLTFAKPQTWTVRPAASSMRVAEFVVPKAAGDVEDGELIVYYFGGGGGYVQANIDRWIGGTLLHQAHGSVRHDPSGRFLFRHIPPEPALQVVSAGSFREFPSAECFFIIAARRAA